MVDVIVLERDELSVSCGAEAHPLLGAGTMTNRLEHHLAADDKFDRLAQLPRRRDGERAMCPWPQLAAETGANKLRDDTDVLFRQPEHLREDASKVEDALRLLVNGQHRAIPNRRRRLKLDRVVRLGRRDIGLVELDWCACESTLGIPAFALHAFYRGECGVNLFRLIIRFEIGFDVRFLLDVRCADRIGGGFSGLESVRHSERYILAVVANDIILERRSTLVDDAFEPLS